MSIRRPMWMARRCCNYFRGYNEGSCHIPAPPLLLCMGEWTPYPQFPCQCKSDHQSHTPVETTTITAKPFRDLPELMFG